MRCIAIDPGTEKSAILWWDGVRVENAKFEANEFIANELRAIRFDICFSTKSPAPLVIEKIESQGMAVGAETFETVYWSGIFAEAYGLKTTHRLGRRAVKLFHCNSARATDANIRMSIIDRFGGTEKAIGKKKTPGPLYGISGHLWAALALAIAWSETKACTNSDK